MFTPADLQIRPSRISGMGVFTRQAIPAGTRVLEYVGRRVSRNEAAAFRDKTYFIEFADGTGLDGGAVWNPAGFVNHSCAPNCDFGAADGRLWIVTRRAIAAGEELSFNYGYRLAMFLKNPCCCGARTCAGFIVAERFHPLLRWFRENKPGVRPPVYAP